MSSLRRLLIVGASLSSTLAACLVAFDTGPRREDDPPGDAASADSPSPPQPVDEAGTFAFDDERNWEEHALDGTFAGATFDGRYVYFAPRGHSTLWRYDTTAGFDDTAAWTSVVLPGGDAAASSIVGTAFAGGHVYLAPMMPSAVALRYDVSAPFSTTSWQESANLATVAPSIAKESSFASVVPFRGAIYFLPTSVPGLVRYDPKEPFGDGKSWSMLTVDADAGTAAGSVPTDAGLYLVPANGRRLAVFDSPADGGGTVLSIGPSGVGDFLGATTDGNRLYFAPALTPRAATVAVGADFLDKKLPLVFPLETFARCGNKCFAGAVFDGRHVYFVPRNQARFVRYDTRVDEDGFIDALNWSVGRPDAGNTGFFGGAFDGRWVYFVPDGSGRVVRFHAREPAALPDTHSGSFL